MEKLLGSSFITASNQCLTKGLLHRVLSLISGALLSRRVIIQALQQHGQKWKALLLQNFSLMQRNLARDIWYCTLGLKPKMETCFILH